MPDFIDIGANLAHDSFDEDREQVLARARAAGVGHIVLTGSSIDSNARAAEIANDHTGLSYTAGVHPHHADDYDRRMHETLAQQMAAPGVSAAGECGLDYFRNFASHENQAAAFRAQLELACEHQLPVFLHQRDAHDDFVAQLRPFLNDLPAAVAHCFTAGEAELDTYLELGLYIGITGWICDERRGAHLLPLMPRIPDDRLMIETDAPYLLPRTIRPRPKTRRNEPCWLPEVARVVAAARQQSVDQLATLTSANATRFFGLDTA
ncbi:MAG: TatD family hydrolase [Pseudomonadota bacterium]